ncbi:hypothetical protein [Nitrospira calida]
MGLAQFLLIFVAGMAFYYGTYNAHLARTGRDSMLVDVSRSKLSLQYDARKPVVYIGYVSGYFVLPESISGAIVFVKAKDDAPALLLLPNPNRS